MMMMLTASMVFAQDKSIIKPSVNLYLIQKCENDLGNCEKLLQKYPANKSLKDYFVKISVQKASYLHDLGRHDEAVDTLLYAYPYNLNNDSLHALLAALYYEKGDLFEARKEIQTALLFKPSDPYLIKFSAEINYKLSNYEDAASNNIKLNIICSIPAKFLDTEKITDYKEKSEKYNRISSHPFVIYYPDESYKERALWIAQSLRKTYFRLSSWLNYRAEHEIEVYLVQDRRNLEMPHTLKYAVGIYDGKIRLLVDHHDKNVLQKIAAHEYTHHVLYGLTNHNIPFWCNEGLAQYVSGECLDLNPDELTSFNTVNFSFSFEYLESPITEKMSYNEVRMAYLQSYFAVNYLVSNYGEGIIADLLEGLKSKKPVREIIEDITLLSYDEFEQEVFKSIFLSIRNS